MATRTALLKLLVDFAQGVEALGEVGEAGKKSARELEKEFDRVQLDEMEAEADSLVSHLLDLGRQGQHAFREIVAAADGSEDEIEAAKAAVEGMGVSLERMAAHQRAISEIRSIPKLEDQLERARAEARRVASELNRVQAEERETGRAVGSKKLQGELVEATNRARLLERQLGEVRREERRLGAQQGTGNMLAGIRGVHAAAVALGAVLTTGVLGVGIRKVTELAKEQELADRNLAAAIETLTDQGRVNLEVLKEQAAELQRVTTVGDEATQAIQALVVRFTQLNDPETIRLATSLSIDLAAAMRTDVNQAALQVSKSLGLLGGTTTEVTTAITNLRRAGIILSAQDQERIKTLTAQNNVLEAQNVLLGALEDRYGGAAAAARDTLDGAIKSLQNSFGDLLETVGEEGLTDALRTAAERIRELIEDGDELAVTLGKITVAAVKAGEALVSLPAILGRLSSDLGEAAARGDVARETLRDFDAASQELAESLARDDLGAASIQFARLFSIIQEQGGGSEERLEDLAFVADLLVEGYRRAGRDVPLFLQRVLDANNLYAEETEATLREVLSRLPSTLEEPARRLSDALTRVLEETGGNLRLANQQQADELRVLADAVGDHYKRLGDDVPDGVQRVVEAVEKISTATDKVQEALARARIAQQEFAEEIAASAEEAQTKLDEFYRFVIEKTGGDLRQATEEQLSRLQQLAQQAVEAYNVAGDAVPENVEKITSAVEHQLEVIEAKRQQQIALADQVAAAEEESARRQVEAAKAVEKAAVGGELTEDAKNAAQEAERLSERLRDVGDELDRLDQQPLAGDQLTVYNQLVDEALVLQRQLRDAQRAATEVTVAQGSEIDKLGQEQQQQAKAMADLLRVSDEYRAGGGRLVDRLEEMRLATLLFGSEQRTVRDELAEQIDGWDKLSESQKDQLEQQAIHAEQSKRLIRELREEVETEAERIVAAHERMSTAMAAYVEECENARRCLQGLG